jgi:hypothetical protein
MPSRPAAIAAAATRYGFPEESSGFSSTFAAPGRRAAEPAM